jgi:hypothetical protein
VVVFCSFLCIAVIDGVGYTTGEQTVFSPGNIACIRTFFDWFFCRSPLESSGDRFEEWQGGDIFRGKSSGRASREPLCRSSSARLQVGAAPPDSVKSSIARL